MLDAVLRKEAGCARLDRVDGEKLVALRGEQDHGRAIGAPVQALEIGHVGVVRGLSEQQQVDVREVQAVGRVRGRVRDHLLDGRVGPLHLDVVAQQPPKFGIVVDD